MLSNERAALLEDAAAAHDHLAAALTALARTLLSLARFALAAGAAALGLIRGRIPPPKFQQPALGHPGAKKTRFLQSSSHSQ